MKHKFRVLALMLLLAVVLGLIPAALADDEPSVVDLAEEASADSAVVSPQIPPPVQEDEPEVENENAVEDDTAEEISEEAVGNDGLLLTRALATSSSVTMGKSTCVTFSAYTSPTWHCNRYNTLGTHVYGHYYYTSEIAYHTIDGTLAYCIEPNTSSLSGKTYSGYSASGAASDSYWMLELDATQRSYIQQILAFGYPEVDYGYSKQVQYAATQTLIWEVVSKCRYSSGIQYSSDYGLFSKIYAVLGADYQACYDGILNAISVSDGTVPSFAGSSSGGAKTIELSLNSSTNCYEASVTDSSGVLPHFTFAYNGVTFTQSGNTLNISVPASAESVKEQVISGTSDQQLMSTSNPTIWENSDYQTVLTAGGADALTAYIKLTWDDAPETGNLVVSKSANYGTVEGFTFRLHGTSDAGNAVDLTAATDSNGKAYFHDVEVGSYTLEEITPGKQYLLPEPQTVTIPEDDSIEVTMENTWKFWSARVVKVDAETGTAQGDASLNGAEYTLYKSGEAVTTYTVQNGGFTTDSFPCTESDGVYTLKETKAPEGYTLNETVYELKTAYGHYSEANNRIALTVSDTVIRGRLQLQKLARNTVSGEDQPEAGAEFGVWLKSAGGYDAAEDSERDMITIGEDGTGTSKDLPYGTYCIQQKSGWEGYEPDQTVYEATISESGAAVTLDTIYNDIWTGQITILKVDKDSQTPLSGAEFTLTGSDGSEASLTTDENGRVAFENLVYSVTYTWTETKAPRSYVLDEANTGTWRVSKANDSVEITCEDVRRPGSITVTKQDSDGDPLAGAVFLLEYLDGAEWKPVTVRSADEAISHGTTTSNVTDGKLTTDETGAVTFDGLWADETLQYRLTEVEAPAGYALLTEPVFEGVLPVSYPEGEVTAEPDEILDGTAYFYTLPITVQNGKVYTLPQTGGDGFPFVPVGILMALAGAAFAVNFKYPYLKKNLKRMIFRRFFA